MGNSTVSGQLFQYGGSPVSSGGGLPFLQTGKAYFVDPANGSDGNTGKSPSQAFATIYKGHAACTSGKNDVVYLIGDGGTTATARLSTALASGVDSTVTAGTLVWSKSATHLVGIAAPATNRRARIATPTGTYTYTTFGSVTNLITVSGSGCYMANTSVFSQFSTGGTGEIALAVTGSRNYFAGFDILGPGSTAAIQAAGSRGVKITGGENYFYGCQLGLDTVTRTAANATIEFASATARNTFENCVLPFQTSSATVLGILCTGSGAIDRWQRFKNCVFINNTSSTSTTMTVLASMTSASPGGMLVFEDCSLIGVTDWGDTNALANSYVTMAASSASAGGIGVNPS